jgi:response regulator of citrate/malate metabolism
MLEGKKILIVDDELQIIESHKNKFKFRAQVNKAIPLFATTAEEAKRIMLSESPDLIYLDLSLGESKNPDGIEILREFAKTYSIVVVTGHGEYEQECLALGAKGYLVKPIDFNKMMEEGDKILNHQIK